MKKLFDLTMLAGWLMICAGTFALYGAAIGLIVAGASLITLTLLEIVLLKGNS